MARQSVGISDIGIYVPGPEIEIQAIVEERGRREPELGRHLRRAWETTGQMRMRFPEAWEDPATLAAQSAMVMLRQNEGFDPSRLRYLAVGTESGVDHSKAMAAYAGGMLQKAGVAVPRTISTFQVQHACAGGALAAIGAAALLSFSNRRGESGLVLCSDIARYAGSSTAEITQGAGAAALLIEEDPALVELDLSDMGFASSDVDDFFRPLGSTVAMVRGGYSTQCYIDSLELAFSDHCERRGEKPEAVLEATDYFILHVPFRNMALRAMKKLLMSRLGLAEPEADAMLAARSFQAGIDPIASIGNTYTASIFMSLAFLLDAQFKLIGDRIVGKRLLLASYGSGNTMAVISAKVAAGAPAVLARWRTGEVWSGARRRSWEDYERWLDRGPEAAGESVPYEPSEPRPGYFRLAGIRKDGYREYALG
jgi:hydroxymethylglutaryl-CoA synthase